MSNMGIERGLSSLDDCIQRNGMSRVALIFY
jgi:hypothetical protein